MTEREKLITRLEIIKGAVDQNEQIADMILADRRRICAPFLKLKRGPYFPDASYIQLHNAGLQTLKLAGLDKE